jgi:hypothetical protein
MCWMPVRRQQVVQGDVDDLLGAAGEVGVDVEFLRVAGDEQGRVLQ